MSTTPHASNDNTRSNVADKASNSFRKTFHRILLNGMDGENCITALKSFRYYYYYYYWFTTSVCISSTCELAVSGPPLVHVHYNYHAYKNFKIFIATK